MPYQVYGRWQKTAYFHSMGVHQRTVMKGLREEVFLHKLSYKKCTLTPNTKVQKSWC